MPVIRRATEAAAATIHALVVELAAAIGMTGKIASSVADIRDKGFGSAAAAIYVSRSIPATSRRKPSMNAPGFAGRPMNASTRPGATISRRSSRARRGPAHEAVLPDRAPAAA